MRNNLIDAIAARNIDRKILAFGSINVSMAASQLVFRVWNIRLIPMSLN